MILKYGSADFVSTFVTSVAYHSAALSIVSDQVFGYFIIDFLSSCTQLLVVQTIVPT